MSYLVYYFIFHLCVSMHACNSRHLGVFHKESESEVHHLTIKAPETIVELEGKHIDGNNIKQKESTLEFLTKHIETENMVPISQEKSKIKEWKNHGRSTMESKKQDSKEDIKKSTDNSFAEDVVVMDYAQPHRKPPIHNLDP